MTQLRQTAYKVWVGDLIKSQYVEQQGEWDPNYFLVGNNKVSRVNLVASIISVYENQDKTMKSVEVDDGSGSISLKAWSENINLLNNLDIGTTCLIIGRPRKNNDQIFVTPEIIKKIDMNWVKFRKLELENLYGKRDKVENKSSVDNKTMEEPVEGPRQKVLNILEKSGEIKFQDLVDKSGVNEVELKKIIDELLKEGEIFEPKPSYLRVV